METFFSKEEELEEVAKLVPDSTWFRSIRYQTETSCRCQRRVVTKVVYGSNGLKIRHVVTSLPANKIPPSKLYTNKYCPRGEMENRTFRTTTRFICAPELQHKHLRVIN